MTPAPHRYRRNPLLRRGLLAGLTALLAGSLLAACSATSAAEGTGAPGTASADASAPRTIEHTLGSTEITGTPKRVVALEFSFVQALDELGVTPVGITDDDQPERIEQLLGKTIDYQSVGTRLEPNLELVSSLKPDLIIADETRHSAIYDQLSQIAPTIVLNSWEGTYQDIKDSVVTIADALGEKQKGEDVIAAHEKRMAAIKATIPAGDKRTYLLAVSNPADMSLHTSSAFTGDLFVALGLTPAITSDEPIESGVGIERLVSVNPDVLFVATDGPGTVYDDWKTTSTWAGMSAARNDAVYEVDRNQFSRFRGIRTAELNAEAIAQKITGAD